MGSDRGDSFPFDFELNGNPFGSKSKVKLSPRSYPIQCERNWKYSFVNVVGTCIGYDHEDRIIMIIYFRWYFHEENSPSIRGDI